MSYQGYVVAAYVVFAVVLLWDLVSPQVQIRQQLRAVRLRATRTQRDETPPSGVPLSRE